MKMSVRFAVALAAASWMFGCAQNVGDIDETQADRIDVSILNDGKPWYFLQTTIGSPPQSGVTFIGESMYDPGVERIVWDVQEDWLVAYRNYEFIAGSQIPYSSLENDTVPGNGVSGSRSAYFGTPAAAYPILSHFDVERQYDPQTGEQTNVISENTTDRPWYERQYVRVDWANNAFGGFHFLYLGGLDQQSILPSPLSYYVDQSDPTNPDHSEITSNYIGIVNKVSYQGQIDVQASQYYGQTVYQCYAQDAAYIGLTDCGPGEIKIRLSFEKIPATHDFVPRQFTDKDEIMFGAWQSQRETYDPQRGVIEPILSQNQFAVMHHIWQKDHKATDSNGNACDVNNFDNTDCILPLNQRTPKPIVYYVSPGWPSISDPSHYSMWVHESLISNDYNADMRGVVAGALRGWDSTKNDYLSTSVEYWATHNGVPLASNVAKIDYTQPASSYNRYSAASGLDYMAYPPMLNPSTNGGNEDLTNDAYLGTRPSGTWIGAGNTICDASQIAQSLQAQQAGKAGPCTMCDPKKGYCMGIDHVPYSVVPRMVVFCHNPVQPRVISTPWTNPLSGVTLASIDKSDSNNPNSFDFSSPGDPDICDPRSDADRVANPLSPQLGDLRYHMHAYIPEPDGTSPGGIGEPASDPVTGEIVSSHAYVYGRAVENWASLGADMVAVLNGWESYGELINGNIVNDYVTTLQSGQSNVIFKPSQLKKILLGGNARNRIAELQRRVGASYDGSGRNTGATGNLATTQYHTGMFNALGGFTGQGVLSLFDPHPSEMWQIAPAYPSSPGSSAPPASVLAQSSMANFIAPDGLSTFNSGYENSRHLAVESHLLLDEDIEPTALRLAKYYKDKFGPQGGPSDPCSGPIGNSTSAEYRTCIWEEARKDILGNVWRSYSDHEVGHTFGQYHNFAASTDALNYFDPYWDMRVNNSSSTIGQCAAGDTTCQELTSELGSVPIDPSLGGPSALAPEWLQAPALADLQNGLREYQYTSIMDYNSLTFNSDFQGLGKYDHACHMYQYGNMVEVFDPNVLPKVPGNSDSDPTSGAYTHLHQIDDQVLQPFNRHYTIYPWIIADGATGPLKTQAQTPLTQAVQEMIHARKWVRYDDLFGATNDLPTGLTPKDVQARDGFPDVATLSGGNAPGSGAVMVPYRFCSDNWEGGTAWCYAFDQGADVYEQANTFIQDYKYFYFFNNFKRQSVNFVLGGDGTELFGSYYSRLWNRNFGKQAQIAQHFVNDELIIRGNEPCTQDSSPTGTYHWSSLACGMDRTAAVVATVDFMTKLMQTPNPDTLQYDPGFGLLCGATTCAQDGYAGVPAANAGIPLPTAVLQPGNSAKNDISQYNLDSYGLTYNQKPIIAGIWVDKLLAAQALGDYSTYFVGELNNQPLSYLISMGDLFQNEIVRAMGALIVNDPRYWPLVAVNQSNPQDPANPPVTLYRNSAALQNVAINGPYGLGTGFGFPVKPWCPAGDTNCSLAPALDPPLTGTGYQPSYEPPPPNYGVVAYTPPAGGVAPIIPLLINGQNPLPQDPSPVYFEKLIMLSIGAVYMTNPQVGNFENFIEGIRIMAKGNGYASTYPPPMTCDGDPTKVIVPTATSCGNGQLCAPGSNCSDGTTCTLRNWTCAAGVTDEQSRTAKSGNGHLTGICYYGGSANPTSNFGYANCDPDFYAEYDEGAAGNGQAVIDYAIRFVPSAGDFTDPNGVVDPYNAYSPGYEILRLARQQVSANSTGLGASQLIPIFKSYYAQYANSYEYGAPFSDGIQGY